VEFDEFLRESIRSAHSFKKFVENDCPKHPRINNIDVFVEVYDLFSV
jgi:hypothetical protein